jgi:L-2-hydroxyglutarate oxidase
MTEFCQVHAVPYETCGKLIVAADQAELPRLQDLCIRGQQNGLQGLRMLGREEFREIEPHAAGVAALHVPQEGIVDYKGVCCALTRVISERGGQVVTRARVTKLRRRSDGWTAITTAGDFEGNVIVNCAGLHSDRVCQLAGERREVRIVPFRGEYYKLRKERQFLVRNLIYPVADPKFPFLGVHFTRLIHGGIEAGPNAVLAFAREGYRKSNISLRDSWDALSYPGLWRFIRKYPRMTWHEMRRSFSKDLFAAALQRLVPEIRAEDLEPGGAGVRAQAMGPDGSLVQDFRFLLRARAVHVLNAPSPAATASLAIGEQIADQVRGVV